VDDPAFVLSYDSNGQIDYYEWRPERSGVSQCMHQAGVEAQACDARNFWMRGSGTVPLGLPGEITTARGVSLT
jgi:hypothetical protein